MGFQTIYFGAIVSNGWKSEDKDRFHRANKKVISSLSHEDDFPYLTRGIFHLNEEEAPFGGYDDRVITFGSAFKSAESEWDDWLKDWLPKFENLLRQMFWTEAYIHLHGAMGGYYKCFYKAENTSEGFYRDPVLPVAMWKFIGDWDESEFFDSFSNTKMV